MKQAVSRPVEDMQELSLIKEKLKKAKKPIHISGAIDSGQVHLAGVIGEGYRYKLFITFTEQKAREIYEDMRFFCKDTYYYPAKDFIFFSADIHGNLMLNQRLEAIRALKEREDVCIVTTIDGLLDKLVPMDIINDNILKIDYDSVILPEELKIRLTSMGYERCEQVETQGQFAVRGSIVDIFTPTESEPYRLDFWDDTIDSIKIFDPVSQRTIESAESIVIYPATEHILTDDMLERGIEKIKDAVKKTEKIYRDKQKNEEAHRIKTVTEEFVEQLKISRTSVSLDSYMNYFYEEASTLLEYLPYEDTVIFLDEPVRSHERCDAVLGEFKESMINRIEKGYALNGQADVLITTEQLFSMIERRKCILFTALDQKFKVIASGEKYQVSVRNVNPYNNSFETLVKDLERYKKSLYRVLVLSASKTKGIRLADTLLNEFNINAFYSEDDERVPIPGEVMITHGNVHKGFEYPLIKYVVMTESDIFGVVKKKKKSKTKYSGQKIADFAELNIGDYVVHENHGLGIYRGIEKMEVDNTTKDYIKIEYDKGGNLYIPTTQFDMIQKYAGSDARRPKLNKLGTKEWSATKAKVKGAVRDVARELVELYAARSAKSGYKYGEDTLWQREFEELFPFEETDDQLAAIADTKKDMESTKIMDRLICGDVGYGKTEIAIRAAFKAVQEGKQVAFLVPTTILAQQHYNTFIQRMKDYPVNIELMCRFRTPAQQKHAIEGLKKGTVEIVIGTHRLLSKDIAFKDLGLLVVDEEQRFGVTHKEKIKQLKKNIDVLTLTATPIPRTLHMGLVGIRDMSVLEEPPVDRLPIQTFVMEYNDEMVREAINRELARNGQVYYVYNRVNNIDEITNQIAKLVPDANVVFAHGQMSERKLEQIMYDFINGDIDVLVSTTIIETGLDISNVNTIIIHDADKLGLSQLYQLRGRVGRSNRTSYAFLMYKRDRMLKEVAEKRLSAIREFTDLGSGFKIAMRDLEIRGAGNILGAEQHGHMEAVGYDLYCKMLNEAVLVMKGEREDEEDYETSIDVKADAYIPASYIRNELQKLNMYKKISLMENRSEYEDMQDELLDRFGEPPRPVQNLLRVALIKAAAHTAQITEIKGDRQRLKISLYPRAKIDINMIPDMIKKYRNDMKFCCSDPPYFEYMPKRQLKNTDELFDKMDEIVQDIEGLK